MGTFSTVRPTEADSCLLSLIAVIVSLSFSLGERELKSGLSLLRWGRVEGVLVSTVDFCGEPRTGDTPPVGLGSEGGQLVFFPFSGRRGTPGVFWCWLSGFIISRGCVLPSDSPSISSSGPVPVPVLASSRGSASPESECELSGERGVRKPSSPVCACWSVLLMSGSCTSELKTPGPTPSTLTPWKIPRRDWGRVGVSPSGRSRPPTTGGPEQASEPKVPLSLLRVSTRMRRWCPERERVG